jgi:hypothetical protein
MVKLSEIVRNHLLSQVSQDYVVKFGDSHDGIIEIPALTKDGGVVEVGYFYGDIKPKNIINISSQIGCPSRCKFCEVGNERFVRSLTADEIYEQAILMLKIASGFGIDIDAIKHKGSIAKTGEPLLNPEIVEGIRKLSGLDCSFKISTILPDNNLTEKNYRGLAEFAAEYPDSFQMQISLISTSEEYRQKYSGIKLMTFRDIAKSSEIWHRLNPTGRKTNLSLILAEQIPCNAETVLETFPPELFRFRFRPYISNQYGTANGLTSLSPERLTQIKEDFQDKGYEVDEGATPTPTEFKFGLVANVTRKRYLDMISEA